MKKYLYSIMLFLYALGTVNGNRCGSIGCHGVSNGEKLLEVY